MNPELKYRILKHWGLFRFIRLGLALFMLGDAWKTGDTLIALIGSVLLFQSITNTGCANNGSCDINHLQTGDRSSPNPDKKTNFE